MKIHNLGRDAQSPADNKNFMKGEEAQESAALRCGNAELFLAAEDRLRLPERLQKKIDRFSRQFFRAGEMRCT